MECECVFYTLALKLTLFYLKRIVEYSSRYSTILRKSSIRKSEANKFGKVFRVNLHSAITMTNFDKDFLVRRFNEGKAEITPYFQEILNEFFPKYLDVVMKDKYHDKISEIRIEG